MAEPTQCRYCAAAYPMLGATECAWEHRDDPRVYDLGRVLARLFTQSRQPTDEQIGWYLADANAVVDDFNPTPDRWRARRLPDSDEFEARLRINDVTYVIPEGGKDDPARPVRLATYRAWIKEADDAAAARWAVTSNGG